MSGRLDYRNSLLRVCRFSLIASALSICCLYATPTQYIDEAKITSTLEKKYGERASMRARAWFQNSDNNCDTLIEV